MLYESTVVPLVQTLTACKGVIAKGEAHAASRKIAPDALLYARLYPDMYHFTRQVQTACDLAVRMVARLTGRQPPAIVQQEASFADLRALIDRTLDYVHTADRGVVDSMAGKEITFPIADRPMTMTGVGYAHRFAMPNYYFHIAMAYAILRENGVDLGKLDFIGQMQG